LDDRATGTYLPSDDTSLLIKALSTCGGGSCLEIGFGSGAVLRSLVPRFSLVVGTDIAARDRRGITKGSAEVVLADRASCFRDGVFDVVAFNPPYLPSETISDRTVDGGHGGVEVPMRFLVDALRVLKAGGLILVLLSDQGDLAGFVSHCLGQGLSVREREKTRLFYETLFVYEIRRG
jgi:release factor glutamine methyltransferase